MKIKNLKITNIKGAKNTLRIKQNYTTIRYGLSL